MIQSRCIISGVQVLAAYFALQQMPISVQKIIISARPIFTVILARLFLKEAFGKLDVRAASAHLLLPDSVQCTGSDNFTSGTWIDSGDTAFLHLYQRQ